MRLWLRLPAGLHTGSRQQRLIRFHSRVAGGEQGLSIENRISASLKAENLGFLTELLAASTEAHAAVGHQDSGRGHHPT